jgi:phage/plasmid-associated DNA primase
MEMEIDNDKVNNDNDIILNITDDIVVTTNMDGIAPLMEKCIDTGSYFDIAMILHHLYKDKYVVTSIKNKIWFAYKEHKWVRTEIGPYIELSTHVVHLFNEYRKLLAYKQKKRRSKRFADKIIKCGDIIVILNESVCKEKVCKECLYIFYDDQFINKLDEDSNLVPFKNGVYDIENGQLRDGLFSDYLSIYINRSFSPDDLDNDKLMRDFQLFRNEMISKRYRNLYKMYKLKNDYII